LREENELRLRKVAAKADVVVAVLSKMERGERRLTIDIVHKLTKLYKHDTEELLVLFLSDKVLYEMVDVDSAIKALYVVHFAVKNLNTKFAKYNSQRTQ